MRLRELLDEAGSSLPAVDIDAAPDGTVTWSHGGQPFATLSGDGSSAEFQLDLAVAAAAARTPDVVPSGRGPGWVVFRIARLDDHSVDRAMAWFASAHRRIAGG